MDPRTVIVALLVLAGWLTTNHFTPWVSWHSEVPFFALALLAAAWTVLRSAPGDRLEAPLALALPVALSVLVAFQHVVGLVLWRGQVAVALLYGFLAVCFILWGWVEAKGQSPLTSRAVTKGEWFAWILVVGGLLSVAIALAQVLNVWESASFITRSIYARRPGGNLGQPNHLATLFVMAMGAVLFLNIQRKLGAFTALMVLALLVVGVSLTESRTGLIASLGLCLLWAWKRPAGDHGLPRSISAVLGGEMLLMYFSWPSIYRFWVGGQSIGETAAERIGSSGADPRLVLWEQVFEATLLKPLTGWGFRNTAEAHNAISHADVPTLPITYSHNLFLDLAVWFGWPIALVVALMLAIWGYKRFMVVQRTPLGWLGFAIVLPFGIHCLLEFPFAYAYLLMPAMLGIGYIEGSLRPDQLALRVRKQWLALPVFGLAAVAGWSVVDYLRIEEDFRVARFQMLRIGPAPEAPPPQILLLNQLSDMVASTRVQLRVELEPSELELLRRAAVHNPWSGSQYRYATALALNRQPEEARRQMHVLRAQHGIKVYKVLAAQLESDLASRGLPALGLAMEEI